MPSLLAIIVLRVSNIRWRGVFQIRESTACQSCGKTTALQWPCCVSPGPRQVGVTADYRSACQPLSEAAKFGAVCYKAVMTRERVCSDASPRVGFWGTPAISCESHRPTGAWSLPVPPPPVRLGPVACQRHTRVTARELRQHLSGPKGLEAWAVGRAWVSGDEGANQAPRMLRASPGPEAVIQMSPEAHIIHMK